MDFFWEKPHWEQEDKHLLGLLQAPFQRPFPKLNPSPGVQIIRGPRQVGKSSWLKSLLSEQVSLGKKCFYDSCEILNDYKDLFELLKSIKTRQIIFLDEISFVADWPRAVKKFIDDGYKGSLLLTGSNSVELRMGMDQMPGRWAKGKSEHLLMPMLYEEWRSMRELAKWPTLSWVDGLRKYFITGGFPAAVAEAGAECIRPIHSMNIYRQWLLGDLAKLGKQESYLRELLEQLANTICSGISLQTLAQKTQLMSYHTAQDYIELLEKCFALRTLYAIDPDTKKIRYKKQKKYYFTDPLIYWIAKDWQNNFSTLPDVTDEAKIAEQVAHEYLARNKNSFGYYSSSKGEVDFFKPGEWAIEVKWSAVAKNISRAYQDLRIPNKLIWTQGNFLTK